MAHLQAIPAAFGGCSHQPSDEIINSILEAVSQFADGQPQRDDVTLVVMRVQPGCDF